MVSTTETAASVREFATRFVERSFDEATVEFGFEGGTETANLELGDDGSPT